MGTKVRGEIRADAPGAGTGLLIHRLARAAGWRLARALEEHGMRPPEFVALHHLAEAGPVSQQELGEAIRINPSNLVGLLDALERDGQLVRDRDPDDRRRHLVDLTAAGRRRLAEARRAAADAEEELLAPLAPRERARFRAYLERLTTHACGCSPMRGGRGGAGR